MAGQPLTGDGRLLLLLLLLLLPPWRLHAAAGSNDAVALRPRSRLRPGPACHTQNTKQRCTSGAANGRHEWHTSSTGNTRWANAQQCEARQAQQDCLVCSTIDMHYCGRTSGRL
jgi:hypothetical protein